MESFAQAVAYGLNANKNIDPWVPVSHPHLHEGGLSYLQQSQAWYQCRAITDIHLPDLGGDIEP